MLFKYICVYFNFICNCVYMLKDFGWFREIEGFFLLEEYGFLGRERDGL